MNLLLIITPFNPAQTPNTIRWNALIDKFVNDGYKVTVLSSNWTGQNAIEINGYVKTYRTGHNTLLDFLWNKLGVKNRRNVSNSGSVQKSGFFVSILEKFVDRFWRKRYWPDGSVLFLKPGKKIIPQILEEESITHMVSVGLPFTCHLIAQEAKLKFPDVKWTMDVQDPFSISDAFWVNNFSKYAMKNIQAEQECLAAADNIVFTNSTVLSLYEELFKETADKFYVVSPLVDLAALNKNRDVELELNSDKKHVAYFGSFYEGVRSPFRFLKFLDYIFKNHKHKLEDIQFHFYGELNKFSNPIFLMFDHLSPFIIHHGFVEHELLSSHVKHYDLLLNFGNTTNYHLPSKVVELLYFNKPVINVVSSSDDSTSKFLIDKVELCNLSIGSEVEDALVDYFLDYVFLERKEAGFNISVAKEYGAEKIANDYLAVMRY